MVAGFGGALRRPRRENARLSTGQRGFGFGGAEGDSREPPLRLPQTGLADRLLLDRLRGQGVVDAASLISAQAAHLRDGIPALDQLVAGGASAEMLLEMTAEAAGTEFLQELPPVDAALVDRLGLQTCLARNLAPLGQAGSVVVLATGRPTETLRHARMIRARLGAFRLVLATEETVSKALLRVRGQAIAEQVHQSVEPSQSCRSLGGALWRAALLCFAVAVLVAAMLFPAVMLGIFTVIAVGLLVAMLVLRLAALRLVLASWRQKPPLSPPEAAPLAFRSPDARGPREPPMPLISVLVPLLRESQIAERLVRRLSLLDYPRERLEILLIVEARDWMTKRALARAVLPDWMRIVEVPIGPVQTKPRALNYALALARGSLIGVYDAEDAPEPDQLRKVAAAFALAPPEVVCLQGALDFYNPRQSLLTQLFTLDYACWFRVLLPGISKMGLVIPLGGTTLFFRRKALQTLGGWDAWNVTEDADLGLRLARRGWRTELLPSTTYEEATSEVLPWVRQRSRWIKGYAMTWACHMRRPAELWRDLGPRRYCWLQVMLLAPILQPLLAPCLWSFWLLLFGLPHPLQPALGWVAMWALIGIFVAAELASITICIVALRATRHRGLGMVSPLLQAYGWLASFAAWKALIELILNPFYWDKTFHGHSRQGQSASIRRASTRSRVS